jgi:nucleolar protein 15
VGGRAAGGAAAAPALSSQLALPLPARPAPGAPPPTPSPLTHPQPRNPLARRPPGFFSQFGRLTRVRVSRSKKTGRAKHYAFLEFAVPEVARIAADAMDGHIMFAQRLVVRCLKPSEVHPELFKGANRRFKQVPWRKIEAGRHNRERTPQEHAKRIASLLRRDKKRQQRIAAAGIDYEYDGLAAALPGKAKRIKFVD